MTPDEETRVREIVIELLNDRNSQTDLARAIRAGMQHLTRLQGSVTGVRVSG